VFSTTDPATTRPSWLLAVSSAPTATARHMIKRTVGVPANTARSAITRAQTVGTRIPTPPKEPMQKKRKKKKKMLQQRKLPKTREMKRKRKRKEQKQKLKHLKKSNRNYSIFPIIL
jgi:transcriptional regulator of NAD metabolism